MNRLSKWVLKLSPIQLGLLLILMPILSAFLTGILLLASVFLHFEFETPLYEFAFFAIHLIFLIWIWTVSVTINEHTLKIKNRFFKTIFFFYLFNRVVFFLYYLYPQYFIIKIHFTEGVLIVLEALVVLYLFVVFTSFIFLAVFTGDLISKISVDSGRPRRSIDQIPPFLFVIIFPLGIPLLQRQIQDYLMGKNLFGFKYPKNRATKKPLPPTQAVENKTEEKKEAIDKEDPRRFMPK